MGLVEDVGGDDKIEGAEIVGNIPPVEDPRPQAGDSIAVGVVAHPLERRLLVVGGGDGEAGPGGDDRRQTEAAAELEERPRSSSPMGPSSTTPTISKPTF